MTVLHDPDTAADVAAPRLEARGLRLGYGERAVVHDLDLQVPTGRVTAVVGANACGKSTLLRGLARLLRPAGGSVLLDGVAIGSRPTREVARTLGLLPQAPATPEGITVADLVHRGRFPHQGLLRRRTREDDEAVARALRATDTLALADVPVDRLSGGQRQRAWIAMALAQETDLLLLDEPTSYLDVAHQLDVLELLAALNRERGTTVVMVLHELNLACRYADHLVVMRSGRIVAEGPPRAVMTEAVVEEAFGLRALIAPDPVTGSPLVVPLGRARREEEGR